MQKISIRRTTRNDIPLLVWCSNSAATEEERRGFGSPIEKRKFGTIKRLSESWDSETKDKEILAVEMRETLVGFVIIQFLNDALELEDIAVASQFQGKGIGKEIVSYVEERARMKGKDLITLGTSRNAAGKAWKSLGWWKSLGFQIVGEEHNAWTETFGGSEIRMSKRLKVDTT